MQYEKIFAYFFDFFSDIYFSDLCRAIHDCKNMG